VARAFAKDAPAAIAAARTVLGVDGGPARPTARMARLTAIRVLEAVGGPAAKATLEQVFGASQQKTGLDAVLQAHALRALRSLRGEKHAKTADAAEAFAACCNRVLNAPTKEERIAAIRRLVAMADPDAIPYLRASYAGDVSLDVREEAGLALGQLGDVDSVDLFVRLLRARHENPGYAKIAVRALAEAGDARGIDELLQACADGWQPLLVSEAIRRIGRAALEPLLDLVDQRPEVLGRKAVVDVLAAIASDDLARVLCRRLDGLSVATPAVFLERAGAYMTVAGAHEQSARECAQKILQLRPSIRDKNASKEERALARRCVKAIA
jgi:HEAT repeat protein